MARGNGTQSTILNKTCRNQRKSKPRDPEKHFVGWSAWRCETQAGNNTSQELSRGQWIRSRQSSQPCTHRELLSDPEKPRLVGREQQSDNTVPQSTSRQEQFNPLFSFILKLRACRISQELWIQPSPALAGDHPGTHHHHPHKPRVSICKRSPRRLQGCPWCWRQQSRSGGAVSQQEQPGVLCPTLLT